MMKASKITAIDLVVGTAAGAVATWASGPIQNFLYLFTPRSAKAREEQVRPGSPTEVAAKKLAQTAGASPSNPQIAAAATAIHYGSGVPWGAVYPFLRRRSGMTPVGAALATGASMWLVLDEALTPAMRFSAPDDDYPVVTHVRGLLTHLAFGAVAAAAAEVLLRLVGATPIEERRRTSA